MFCPWFLIVACMMYGFLLGTSWDCWEVWVLQKRCGSGALEDKSTLHFVDTCGEWRKGQVGEYGHINMKLSFQSIFIFPVCSSHKQYDNMDWYKVVELWCQGCRQNAKTPWTEWRSLQVWEMSNCWDPVDTVKFCECECIDESWTISILCFFFLAGVQSFIHGWFLAPGLFWFDTCWHLLYFAESWAGIGESFVTHVISFFWGSWIYP